MALNEAAEDHPVPGTRWSRVRAWRPTPALLLGVGLHLLVSVPLLVAVVAFNRPQWHPIADLAQTELRVRDVGTRHSPLVGLAGRIGPWYDPGSHPGPMSFWALAPVYRLLGGTALGLSASAAFLHSVAYGLVLWLAHRRGGVRVMAAVGAAGVLLVRAYGAVVFLEPWNPYLPVTWWLVLLLAAWGVLDDDPPMLVVAVVAGSFCAQTHLPYLGLVGGFGGILLAVSAWRIWRGGEDDAPDARARRVRSLGAAVLVGLVLWAPPLIDQVNGVGNLGRVREQLQHPDADPIGPVKGAREVVQRFGLDQWVDAQDVGASPTGSPWNASGILVLGLWVLAALACWTGWVSAPAALRRLQFVLGVGTVLAFVASSRVTGELWYYLYLWAMGLAALTLVAIGWTLVVSLEGRVGTREPALGRLQRAGLAAPVAAGVVLSLLFLTTAPSAEPSRPDLSDDLGLAADQTIAALRAGDLPGGGTDGRYLVRWEDPVAIGSQGIGLVNELERAGLTAGVEVGHRVGGTRHRAMTPDEATAVLVLAVGPAIPTWEGREQGAGTRLAFVDTRTPAEAEAEEALGARIDAALEEGGFTERRDNWRRDVFGAALDTSLPVAVREDLYAYVDFHAPLAVFLIDPSQLPA